MGWCHLLTLSHSLSSNQFVVFYCRLIYNEFATWLCFRFDVYDALNRSIVFKYPLESNGIFIAFPASIACNCLDLFCNIFIFVWFLFVIFRPCVCWLQSTNSSTSLTFYMQMTVIWKSRKSD